MPIYNKLVRDKIPEIIEKTGKKIHVKKLDEAEYQKELVSKLSEELAEYTSATGDEEAIEELADILEVIKALGHLHGAKHEQLEKTRRVKAEKRVRF